MNKLLAYLIGFEIESGIFFSIWMWMFLIKLFSIVSVAADTLSQGEVGKELIVSSVERKMKRWTFFSFFFPSSRALFVFLFFFVLVFLCPSDVLWSSKKLSRTVLGFHQQASDRSEEDASSLIFPSLGGG